MCVCVFVCIGDVLSYHSYTLIGVAALSPLNTEKVQYVYNVHVMCYMYVCLSLYIFHVSWLYMYMYMGGWVAFLPP